MGNFLTIRIGKELKERIKKDAELNYQFNISEACREALNEKYCPDYSKIKRK